MSLAQRARNAPLQLDKDYSAIVRPLVEELRSLSPTSTFDDYARRPAMSKLMGMGRIAYPTLQEFLLKSDDWAIKVSVGYLLGLMDGVTPEATQNRLTELMKDDHPIVRAMAASVRLRVVPGG